MLASGILPMVRVEISGNQYVSHISVKIYHVEEFANYSRCHGKSGH